MLRNNRLYYFILTIITILLGIISRKIDGIPTYFGDVLYAIMIYFGMRMFDLGSSNKNAAILALVFCFCIEFQQLYKAEWILAIRNTTFGHYVLGQGFLCSDLICYTVGVMIAFLFDTIYFNNINN